MEYRLSPVETRIVGALLEKELTTPEYYPLTLNALVNACNQKSNRDPVMSLSENEVENTLDKLRDRRFIWHMRLAGSRVSKYEHNLKSLFSFTDQQLALICVLMLRGPQTLGELRVRTERMAKFSSLEEVEAALKDLAGREDPLTAELPRAPGQKESRFTQLISQPPLLDFTEEQNDSAMRSGAAAGTTAPAGLHDRVAFLEQEVERLHAELAQVREEFAKFRRQFE